MKKILLLLFVFPFFAISQTQIGNDINGESEYDFFGVSVSISLDGTILAVGADGNNGNGNDSGHVRVFNNISGNWIQIGNDINGEAAFDSSGSVSLSYNGNRVAIGASENDGNGESSGHVRVFENILGNWTQIGSDINGLGNFSRLRHGRLSADGNILAVSGQNYPGSVTGYIQVYQFISGNWIQIGNDIFGNSNHNYKYCELSSNGNRIGVIDSIDNGDGSFTGSVKIFENILGNWTQIGETIFGDGNGYSFGNSLSLSSDGNTVAISDPYNITGNGYVKIFKNLSGVWTQIGNNIYGEASNDYSGWSISLSSDGNKIAISAPFNDGNGSNSGHVRIFKNVSNDWIQEGIDINGESPEDWSGESISLSPDGNKVAIGSIFNYHNGVNYGHVRIFNLNNDLTSNDFILNNFTLYPNPSSDYININLNNNLDFIKATIYSISGQLIKTNKTKNININDLSKGTYFIEVVTDKGKATKTFIKE